MSEALHDASMLLDFSIAVVVFFGFFLFAALNFFAAVFYGRADVTKKFGYLDIFTVDAEDLTAMGTMARRCVVIGTAGMVATLSIAVVAAFASLGR